MKKLIQLFLCFCLFFFSMAQAADPSASLSTRLNSIKTIKANFTQIIYDNHHRPIQQSNGRLLLERPGKFRWEVIRPLPQIIIANGAKLWIYDPDLEQVTIRSFKQEAGDAPALLLSHTSTNLEKNFKITSTTSGKINWFLLIPKKSDTFTSIQMGFINDVIIEMRLVDNLGHITRVKFNQVQTNSVISPASFVFRPKAHVDVIDETRRR